MVNLLAEFRAKRKAIEDQQQQAKDANTEVKPNKFAKLHPHVASFVEWYQNHRLSVNTHVNIISHEHTHRIALLFIIVDHFPNELLWRCWLEQYEQVQQSAPQRHRLHIDIYIHAKERQSKQYSTWVESRLVKTFALKPTWGSVDLTKTMVALLHEVSLYCLLFESFIIAASRIACAELELTVLE